MDFFQTRKNPEIILNCFSVKLEHGFFPNWKKSQKVGQIAYEKQYLSLTP
jgi:hypothetical protein